MNTKKILITGATGKTGGHAVNELLKSGAAVRALVHRIDDRSKALEARGVEDERDGVFSGTNHDVEHLTGRKPMGMEEFLGKHKVLYTA